MLDQMNFSADLWLSPGPGGWTFVTLPEACADQIRFVAAGQKAKSWGMIKVKVTIGSSTWRTTIWPDKASGSFLLPVKAAVRKAEKVSVGDTVKVDMTVVDEPRA
ncbi:DUF1905 domain-containing protein [Roseibium sp.]|uniref:DUF1905 domain-containing protein n=1 Tax=Roseibium sp. TaxID=1936156 RepID=UPI003BAD016F